MDRRHQLVIAAAALLLAPGAFSQTYQVGQYMGNLTEAQRLVYYAAGTNAQAAYHAKYTPGAAFLASGEGVRVTGTAIANIGGKAVPLTMASRVPYSAVAGAARALAFANPAITALSLLGGIAGFASWLQAANLEWNDDPATKGTHPFARVVSADCDQGGTVCTQYGYPIGSEMGWSYSKDAACEGFRADVSARYPAYTVQLVSCAPDGDSFVRVRVYPPSDPSSYFTQNYGLQTRQAPPPGTKTPVSWDGWEVAASNPNGQTPVDWKGLTEGILSKGGAIPQSEVRDQKVTGPGMQQGQRTERTLSNGDKQVTQTTHNYTYNNNNVTHNTMTTTTTTNINNEVVNEETETTENAPPDEPQQDLCEKNPDILACQKLKLGELEAKPVVNEDRPLAITPDSGWGAGAASCPQPKTVMFMGAQLAFEYTLFCDFAVAIKPLFIGFAWLSATLTFFGLARRD